MPFDYIINAEFGKIQYYEPSYTSKPEFSLSLTARGSPDKQMLEEIADDFVVYLGSIMKNPVSKEPYCPMLDMAFSWYSVLSGETPVYRVVAGPEAIIIYQERVPGLSRSHLRQYGRRLIGQAPG